MSVVPRDDALSIDDKRKINRICNRFEEDWLAGRRPAIEPYLRQIHPAAQPVLLDELIQLEVDYRRSLDEDVCADDYLRRFPRMREIIRMAFQAALARPIPVRFLPGAMIGRYEVRRTLGAGAFAIVYLAWDGQLEREVAVKVPHRFLLADPSARQRFLTEARMVARLRHPRIVALYDVAELADKESIYLVMQYVAGVSLQQRLSDGPLPPQQAGQIVTKVAEALGTAHESGVFHRDLKPSNILLDEHDEPYICDFGLALHVDEQRGREGEYAGTLKYMAPEQTRGESHRLDGRADIWALGVIHYEMLTGRVPFVGRNRDELYDDILHRDPRPPRQLDVRIPRDQERICLRCLAKPPGQRYATAGDVADALRALERGNRRVWLKVALMLAVMASWGSFFAAALWLPHRLGDEGQQLDVPLHATLDLLVWDAQRPSRRGVRAAEAAALPLRSGDQVRVTVQLNQPAYVYLLWLDNQGVVLPVYPWLKGSWEQRPDQEQEKVFLALPNEQDNGWTMKVNRNGLESLLLLARRSPLPQNVDLQRLLEGISHQSLISSSGAVWFQDGQPLSVNPEAETTVQRPPDLDNAVRIPDPLLQMQRRTAEILRPHFELIRAVSFPVQGGEVEPVSLSRHPS